MSTELPQILWCLGAQQDQGKNKVIEFHLLEGEGEAGHSQSWEALLCEAEFDLNAERNGALDI